MKHSTAAVAYIYIKLIKIKEKRKKLVYIYIYMAIKLHIFRAQELRAKVEVAVLCSPSLIVLKVSVDVKQH